MYKYRNMAETIVMCLLYFFVIYQNKLLSNEHNESILYNYILMCHLIDCDMHVYVYADSFISCGTMKDDVMSHTNCLQFHLAKG